MWAWIWGVEKTNPSFDASYCQSSHFAELEEAGGLLHGDFLLRFAGGLERLEEGEVLLEAAVQTLLVEGEELELF